MSPSVQHAQLNLTVVAFSQRRKEKLAELYKLKFDDLDCYLLPWNIDNEPTA